MKLRLAHNDFESPMMVISALFTPFRYYISLSQVFYFFYTTIPSRTDFPTISWFLANTSCVRLFLFIVHLVLISAGYTSFVHPRFCWVFHDSHTGLPTYKIVFRAPKMDDWEKWSTLPTPEEIRSSKEERDIICYSCYAIFPCD